MHPLTVIFGGIGAVVTIDKLLGHLFRKKKVFISYYYAKDRAIKRLITAWSKNDKFDIDFEDSSADVSLDIQSDEELRTELTNRIRKSDIVLVLIGDTTHSRKWVKYEIREAERLRKPIVAVKQSRNHISPMELKGIGANWVYGFRAKKVSDALKKCT